MPSVAELTKDVWFESKPYSRVTLLFCTASRVSRLHLFLLINFDHFVDVGGRIFKLNIYFGIFLINPKVSDYCGSVCIGKGCDGYEEMFNKEHVTEFSLCIQWALTKFPLNCVFGLACSLLLY